MLGSVLLVLALFFWVVNAKVMQIARRQGHAPSGAPFLSGAFGVIAFRVLPFEILHQLWWLPLILDFTYSAFAFCLVRNGWERFRGRR